MNPPSQTEVINVYVIVKDPQERPKNVNELQPQNEAVLF